VGAGVVCARLIGAAIRKAAVARIRARFMWLLRSTSPRPVAGNDSSCPIVSRSTPYDSASFCA
jgi:hypothetical protein